MSKYRVNLSKYATGALSHQDWTFRQANGTTSATVPTTGTIRVVSGSPGTKVLAYNPVKDIDDVEVLVQFKLSSAAGKQGIVSLRYGGTNEATTTGYTLSGSIIGNKGTFAIDEGATGYAGWTDWNYLAGVTYWARFRAVGSSIKAKLWTDGATEPSAWTLDVTNTQATTGDYSGLHTYNTGNVDYSYVSWGTYGDSAPSPGEAISGPARAITPNDITWDPTNNFQDGRISPIDTIAIHWWDYPSVGATLSGVTTWFKNPTSVVSAHFVVSGNTIINMVDISDTAWHVTGHNAHTIGIEIDPSTPAGTLETASGLIRYLRLVLGENIPVLGHGEFSGTSTLCPGALDRMLLDDLASVALPNSDDYIPPRAVMAADPLNVQTGVPVTFHDMSVGLRNDVIWNFGEGTTQTTYDFSSTLSPFTTNGDQPWAISSSVAKSGAITHNQSSHLRLSVNLPHGGYVKFKRQVSSESVSDVLRFFIDAKKYGYWSGTVAWGDSGEYYIPPGTHELRWSYIKDRADSAGTDSASIDDVVITSFTESTSAQSYAIHTYTQSGKYSPTLYISGPNGWSYITNPDYITVTKALTNPSRAVKLYNGTAYDLRPVKVWNGTSWSYRPSRMWDGTKWL